MTKELNIQTIRQAQAGNMQSLSAVGEQVRQKVDTYIYRLTLGLPSSPGSDPRDGPGDD